MIPDKRTDGGVLITSFAMQPHSQVFGPPSVSKYLEDVESCNSILFAAYRISTKLCVLQETLKFQWIKLNQVTVRRRKLNEPLQFFKDLYVSCQCSRRNYYAPALDVDAFSETALDIFGSIYPLSQDMEREKCLLIFAVVLSDGSLREKLSFLFKEFASSSQPRICGRGELKELLYILLRIPEYFRESENFSSGLVEPGLETLDAPLITEEAFLRWQLSEPRLLVWLPTFYRQTLAGSVRHGVRCSCCKKRNIVGLRYQCLRCIGYDLCQICFFYGRTDDDRSHKLTHPMQEYCLKSSKKDTAKAFFKTLQNKFLKSTSKSVGKKFTPITRSPEITSGSSGFISDDNANDHPVVSAQKKREVESIILRLEEQNERRILSTEDTLLQVGSVRLKLNRLKEIIEGIFVDNPQQKSFVSSIYVTSPQYNKTESTPLGQRKAIGESVNLSPIVCDSVLSFDNTSNNDDDPYSALSTVNTNEITSDYPTSNGELELPDQQLTALLMQRDHDDQDTDIRAEVDDIMGQLNGAFESFLPEAIVQRKGLPADIGTIVSEIGNHLYNFALLPKAG